MKYSINKANSAIVFVIKQLPKTVSVWKMVNVHEGIQHLLKHPPRIKLCQHALTLSLRKLGHSRRLDVVVEAQTFYPCVEETGDHSQTQTDNP